MTTPAMRAMLGAVPAAGGGGGFSPLDLGWHTLFWTGGPSTAAIGYSNGALVPSLPDEIGANDAVEAFSGRQPAWVAADSALNNKPSVNFIGGSNNKNLTVASLSPTLNYAAGVSLVAVVSWTAKLGFMSALAGPGGSRRIYTDGTAAAWRIWMGGTIRAGGTVAAAPAAALVVGFADGSTGNERLWVNGTQVVNADAGSLTLSGLTVGNNEANNAAWQGGVALAGVLEGDITTNPNYAALKAWVATNYGLTIA